MPNTSLPESFFLRPDLCFVEYRNHQALFAGMNRKTYQDSLFLDNSRIRTKPQAPVVLDLQALYKALDKIEIVRRPINFIFHTANCGSTLLSRALDHPGRSLGLREPSPLRQLGTEFTSISNNQLSLDEWKKRLHLVTTLLQRRDSVNEIPIIKANIPVNFMLSMLLSSLVDCRGIMLYSDLESFLVSALKSKQRRQWVMTVAKEVSGALNSPVNSSGNNSIAETAASLWVFQIQLYQEAFERYEGLKSLTSDQFFESPKQTIANAAKHFRFNLNDNEINNIVSSDLFNKYSKNPDIKYNDEIRKLERQQMLENLAPEISAGMRWGENLLTQYNINTQLPNQLF